MGNAVCYCVVHRVNTIRVMLSDGEVIEFDKPVIAKQLMKTYPGHLVVHSQVNRSKTVEGRQNKVSMLRADDTLQLGQTYYLLRLPAQREKGLPSNHSASKRAQSKTTNGVENGKLTLIDHLDQEQDQIGVHFRAAVADSKEQRLHGVGHWKPHLEAIVESPMSAHTPGRGLHSLTMSPLARQAGYVPGSVMNSPARSFSSSMRGKVPAARSPLDDRDPAS